MPVFAVGWLGMFMFTVLPQESLLGAKNHDEKFAGVDFCLQNDPAPACTGTESCFLAGAEHVKHPLYSKP